MSVLGLSMCFKLFFFFLNVPDFKAMNAAAKVQPLTAVCGERRRMARNTRIPVKFPAQV